MRVGRCHRQYVLTVQIIYLHLCGRKEKERDLSPKQGREKRERVHTRARSCASTRVEHAYTQHSTHTH